MPLKSSLRSTEHCFERFTIREFLSLIASVSKRRWYRFCFCPTEISPTPLFSCFFLNIENTRCPFSEFVLFCDFGCGGNFCDKSGDFRNISNDSDNDVRIMVGVTMSVMSIL